MRKLEELINTDEPGWSIVSDWIGKAANKIEVLPRNQKQAEETLVQTQVTTRSLMGAVIYETGGILIDGGWIRILGSGSEKMARMLSEWNKGKTFGEYGEVPPYLFVADDVLGGMFAINGGFLGEDRGNIYYFAADSLEWFPMEISYTEFLLFCFEGKLDQFYEDLRWNGWEEDVKSLSADHAYTFYPFLWTEEGHDINKVERSVVSMDEAYNFNLDMKEQMEQ